MIQTDRFLGEKGMSQAYVDCDVYRQNVTMLKSWDEYWWILLALLYVVVSLVVMRRGMWATVGQKMILSTTYVVILVLPAMHPPSSYVVAVGAVLNLLIYQRMLRKGFYKLEISPKPSESNPSDR
jgi:hypothetical protein